MIAGHLAALLADDDGSGSAAGHVVAAVFGVAVVVAGSGVYLGIAFSHRAWPGPRWVRATYGTVGGLVIAGALIGLFALTGAGDELMGSLAILAVLVPNFLAFYLTQTEPDIPGVPSRPGWASAAAAAPQPPSSGRTAQPAAPVPAAPTAVWGTPIGTTASPTPRPRPRPRATASGPAAGTTAGPPAPRPRPRSLP